MSVQSGLQQHGQLSHLEIQPKDNTYYACIITGLEASVWSIIALRGRNRQLRFSGGIRKPIVILGERRRCLFPRARSSAIERNPHLIRPLYIPLSDLISGRQIMHLRRRHADGLCRAGDECWTDSSTDQLWIKNLFTMNNNILA